MTLVFDSTYSIEHYLSGPPLTLFSRLYSQSVYMHLSAFVLNFENCCLMAGINIMLYVNTTNCIEIPNCTKDLTRVTRFHNNTRGKWQKSTRMPGYKILLQPDNKVKESTQYHCVCVKKKKKKLTKSRQYLTPFISLLFPVGLHEGDV